MMKQNKAAIAEITCIIEDLNCPVSAKEITTKLLQQPGVIAAKVHLATWEGKIKYDPWVTNWRRLQKIIEEMGFKTVRTLK